MSYSSGSAINQQTIMFRYSHRFDEHSGIGQLAKAVNNGDYGSISHLKRSVQYQDLSHLVLSNPADKHLKHLVINAGVSLDGKLNTPRLWLLP